MDKIQNTMPQFDFGNKAAEKWTEEEVLAIFQKMADNAENDETILSLQDAIHSVDLYRSSVDYLVQKYPVFGTLKRDIQDIITRRINAKALEGKFVSAPAIWRMKQLGEKDESHIDHTTDGEKINVINLGTGEKPPENDGEKPSE